MTVLRLTMRGWRTLVLGLDCGWLRQGDAPAHVLQRRPCLRVLTRGRPQFADDRTDHWPPPLFSPWLSLGFFQPCGLLPLSSANCRESGRFPFPLRGRTHRTKGRSHGHLRGVLCAVNNNVNLCAEGRHTPFKYL